MEQQQQLLPSRLVPSRCFTCGRVIGDKQIAFITRAAELGATTKTVYYSTPADGRATKKSVHGVVLDELEVFAECCRTALITAVN